LAREVLSGSGLEQHIDASTIQVVLFEKSLSALGLGWEFDRWFRGALQGRAGGMGCVFLGVLQRMTGLRGNCTTGKPH
jgi:hypothetical protein